MLLYRELQLQYVNKIDWKNSLDKLIQDRRNIVGTKFEKPKELYQVAIFSTYNEGLEVLSKSLKYLYESQWELTHLIVIISQEARAGMVHNQSLRAGVASLDYSNSAFLDELSDSSNFVINPSKLSILFTEHPDGREGEIKGKASNEDWGARQITKYLEQKGIDLEMVLVTSLDADSHIQPFFFHNLGIQYCLTPGREQAGFQPVHNYSNNFFEVGFLPRQIASQTTFFNLTNLAISDQATFFAIYSCSMATLKEVDYWVTDVIAEDAVLFYKCLIHFNGSFKVVPHYGLFAGDAVEASDYLQEVINQYKQLQRWAWGGVEAFPYLFEGLFGDGSSKDFPIKQKLKWIYLLFSNHFFWSSTSFVLSVGVLLPWLLHGEDFGSSNTGQNLALLTQYFSWLSIILTTAFGFLTMVFVASRANNFKRLSVMQIALVIFQFAIAPLIFGLMGLPALDAQIKGITGNYLGYWVTPKS